MRVGIPKETAANETRVAVTPETAAKMIKVGFSLSVESGAGNNSFYSDEEFASSGRSNRKKCRRTLCGIGYCS